MEKKNFVIILGAGESGVGAAILAKVKGFRVFVSDMGMVKDEYKALLISHAIDFEEGGHTFDKLKDAEIIIKSPGIPDNAPIIRQIQEYNATREPRTQNPEPRTESPKPRTENREPIRIISEIEFAARYTQAKMICITGSNGKTTTTSLIYDMLSRAGLDVGLAGNIGNSLALQVALHDRQYYVIELSSFQLDNMYDFRADIAILMNITPDHLDRYDNCFQNYVNAKFRITQNQTPQDAFIYWSEDPVINREIARIQPKATLYPFGQNEHNVAYIDGSHLVVAAPQAVEPLRIPIEQLSLQGQHNRLNSMAASLAAQILNIRNEVIRESLTTFAGVPHRLQYVATVNNIRFINDSKATNVNSCWYALESMTTPTVLILGGKDKGNDYSEIDELVRQKCHTLVFMGLHNEKLHEHFDSFTSSSPCGEDRGGVTIIDTNNLHDAVRLAYEAAHPGDTVLLSPCCASFDLFKNYEERGDLFMNEVRHL